MTDRADEEFLGGIHTSFAEWCKTVLQGVPLLDKDGAAVLKPDGQPWLVPPSHGHMNVIRQFLKDNKIEAMAPKGSALDDLSDLPTFEDENVVPFSKVG
jgi:hypothetical protein